MIKLSLARFATQALALFAAASLSANAGQIVVGGTASGGLQSALTALGQTYTVSGAETPDASLLGAGDVIVIGMDGGTGPFLDYTPFLNAGGRVIVAGGSNWDGYRDWASLYFNITDTGSGWHTDGAWHTAAAIPATAGLPADYTFNNNNATYHMLAFLPTPNTILYGTNDEGQYVGAVRTFSNGGVFNYLALDVSQYVDQGDLDTFTTPWLNNALGNSSTSVPDSGAGAALTAATLFGLIATARRFKARAS